ncbi:MAG TPA: glycosyltransferase family 2 protein [Verrucomicrobiae bacterium]|nr:glycosyltransferase family 2 protein [Verrucomicrobiae bacterium]
MNAVPRAPVALIIFNRPDHAAQVFAQIAAARSPQLFVIADGPRPDVPDDAERCAAARAVVEHVDWDCDVKRNYSDVNLGCGLRPTTGLAWVFQQVDRAIVLEDDCVPDLTFFRFCDEVLERYRDDERVMHVAGNNGLQGRRYNAASYFFSRHNLCSGGWATWARARRHFDIELKQWPALRDTPWLEYIVGEPRGAAVWRRIFDEAHAAGTRASYSDYQWTFICWMENGLSVIPNVELCRNIGFGEGATHTVGASSPWRVDRTEAMRFPLVHPPCVTPDAEADLAINQVVLSAETPGHYGLRQRISRALSAFK